jgi:hypothetical protein
VLPTSNNLGEYDRPSPAASPRTRLRAVAVARVSRSSAADAFRKRLPALPAAMVEGLLATIVLVASIALFAPLFIFPLRDISEAARCRARIYQDPMTSTLHTQLGAYLDEPDPWRKVVICGGKTSERQEPAFIKRGKQQEHENHGEPEGEDCRIPSQASFSSCRCASSRQ